MGFGFRLHGNKTHIVVVDERGRRVSDFLHSQKENEEWSDDFGDTIDSQNPHSM